MKVRLNKWILDEAVYQGPGSCYLWDTELAAFGLRIYPTDRKGLAGRRLVQFGHIRKRACSSV